MNVTSAMLSGVPERRNRPLVTIEVFPPVVRITNRSEHQVRRLYIESINGPQPKVRWGAGWSN